MAKKPDRPDKLTREQKTRLLAAGERLQALGWDPASLLAEEAQAEENLRSAIGDPKQADFATLIDAVRHVAGTYAAPTVRGRLKGLRANVRLWQGIVAISTKPANAERDVDRERLKIATDNLRRLTEALRYVQPRLSQAEARKVQAHFRAIVSFRDEQRHVADGLTKAAARTRIAKSYGFQKQGEGKDGKGPRGGNTTVAESVARRLRNHPDARALAERGAADRKSRK